MDLRDRHVLISQMKLFELAGSEVVTYELARHFASIAAGVTVVSSGFSDDWLARFGEIRGVRCMRIDDERLTAHLEADPPALAWIHHQLIPEQLLRNPGETRFVFHHMSSFQPQEFPISWQLEAGLASWVVFPSKVARERLAAAGVFDGIDPVRLGVLGNPAPDEFFAAPPSPKAALERLVVVSNHVPGEVYEALELLGDVDVSIIGQEGQPRARAVPVTPQVLDADAVITIGKTVQYALARGLPVYCYDHFGGPGWLDRDNFPKARAHTFSGRGFDLTKDPATIAGELRAGFVRAAAEASALHRAHAEEFRLSAALARVFASAGPRRASAPSAADLASHLALQEIMNGLSNAVEARDQTIDYHEGLLAHKDDLFEQTVEYQQGLLDLKDAQLAALEEEVRQLRAERDAGRRRPS